MGLGFFKLPLGFCQAGPGILYLHLKIARVDLQQQRALGDRLVVQNQHLQNPARHLRGNVNDVPVHERIISAFEMLSVDQPGDADRQSCKDDNTERDDGNQASVIGTSGCGSLRRPYGIDRKRSVSIGGHNLFSKSPNHSLADSQRLTVYARI